MSAIARPAGHRSLSRKDVVVYVAGVIAGLIATHAVIAFADDGRITVRSTLLLAVVACFIAGFYLVRRPAIRQRRYAYYFLHVMAFLLVNGSYWLHAGILSLDGRADVVAATWSGALYAMATFWGIGLLIHTLGAFLSKGFEDVDV
ncbi:2TM domain-containing protein [Saxibacter everestensis]|uniref:2TM domain-containing protein n=1 Tax=Saxibacter everestensis TaxID=2909229 RepID=A0ABY8QXL2_9MICO|nr:2TM domain-containing protein [Brevibacteriaceae bacterium ZFBP1038]